MPHQSALANGDPKAKVKQKRFRFSLRTLVVVVVLLGLNGSLAVVLGPKNLEDRAIRRMHIKPGNRRISGAPTSIELRPYHYATARMKFPCVFVVESGTATKENWWANRSYYFWVFVFGIRIPGVGWTELS